MKPRRQVLAANWKLNLAKEGLVEFGRAIRTRHPSDVEVIVAPPFPFLRDVAAEAAGAGASFSVSAQNCAEEKSGAFTGEVSAAMLVEVGASYAIVGHSERRTLYGETDAIVGRKLARARDAGLTPILCIGETEQLKDEGKTLETLETQISGALSEAGGEFSWLIVAYEPVWAIGTGKNATPDEVRAAHKAIEGYVAPRIGEGSFSILYGGSVKPENASVLSAIDVVDGFLVGGASLAAEPFLGIYAAMCYQSLIARIRE